MGEILCLQKPTLSLRGHDPNRFKGSALFRTLSVPVHWAGTPPSACEMLCPEADQRSRVNGEVVSLFYSGYARPSKRGAMIYGNKIRLRSLERTDIPSFVRWFNDPEIRSTLLINEPLSHAAEEKWFENQLTSPDKIFGVEILSQHGEWLLIGNVGLIGINQKDRSASIGLVIGEKGEWNKGYGRDAIKTISSYAFNECNLHRLELEAFSFNERGIHCYETCGFLKEGVKREALFTQGTYHDVHVMSILSHEFKELEDKEKSERAIKRPSEI